MRKRNYQEPHPIWRIMIMTEIFGQIGRRWGINQIDWKCTDEDAAVCVSLWWIDRQTGERMTSEPAWGRESNMDINFMSNAMDKAVNVVLSQIEPSLPFRLIPLSKGFSAIIDAADYDAISKTLWSVLETRHAKYACRGIKRDGKQVMILMHRELASPGDDEQVDHWNHDGLDNRRKNLRICSSQQNSRNTRSRPGSSQFKGVSRNKRLAKWSAQIMVDGKKKHLGFFKNEDDAARAYDSSAKTLFGNFANLNFKE